MQFFRLTDDERAQLELRKKADLEEKAAFKQVAKTYSNDGFYVLRVKKDDMQRVWVNAAIGIVFALLMGN